MISLGRNLRVQTEFLNPAGTDEIKNKKKAEN